MKTFILAFAVSFVISAVPLGTQANNVLTNVDQQAMLTAMSNTTPQEVNASVGILKEALAFFSSFTNLLPAIGSGSTLTITPQPATLAVKFPVEMRVEITAKDKIKPRSLYILQKATITSSWVMAEGWLVSSQGKRVEVLSIPNLDEQHLANTRLPEVVKEMQEDEANQPAQATGEPAPGR